MRLFSDVFGIAVSGECLISGDLEIRYDDGLQHIAGVLHSAPGTSGNLRFRDTSGIAGGIALVEEALKDFRCRRARVAVGTQDDALNVSIELRGKPNRDLPLVYDKEAHTFVRDRTGRHRATIKELPVVLRFSSIPLALLGRNDLTGALLDALQKPEVNQ